MPKGKLKNPNPYNRQEKSFQKKKSSITIQNWVFVWVFRCKSKQIHLNFDGKIAVKNTFLSLAWALIQSLRYAYLSACLPTLTRDVTLHGQRSPRKHLTAILTVLVKLGRWTAPLLPSQQCKSLPCQHSHMCLESTLPAQYINISIYAKDFLHRLIASVM